MFRFLVHYGIHFLVPFMIALLFYRNQWFKITLILLAGILIDIDHIFANPIFDPNRCSIGFHPLHSSVAITSYVMLLFIKKTRIVGLSLLIHILADSADCLLLKF